MAGNVGETAQGKHAKESSIPEKRTRNGKITSGFDGSSFDVFEAKL